MDAGTRRAPTRQKALEPATPGIRLNIGRPGQNFLERLLGRGKVATLQRLLPHFKGRRELGRGVARRCDSRRQEKHRNLEHASYFTYDQDGLQRLDMAWEIPYSPPQAACNNDSL